MSYRDWLVKANKDLRMAKLALREGMSDYAVFHAQQAAEKYIKAFLVKHGKPFGRTHNLRKLIDLCKEIDEEFQYLIDIGVDTLYPMGIEARYPGIYELDEDDARKAIELAEKTRDFVLRKLAQKSS